MKKRTSAQEVPGCRDAVDDRRRPGVQGYSTSKEEILLSSWLGSDFLDDEIEAQTPVRSSPVQTTTSASPVILIEEMELSQLPGSESSLSPTSTQRLTPA